MAGQRQRHLGSHSFFAGDRDPVIAPVEKFQPVVHIAHGDAVAPVSCLPGSVRFRGQFLPQPEERFLAHSDAVILHDQIHIALIELDVDLDMSLADLLLHSVKDRILHDGLKRHLRDLRIHHIILLIVYEDLEVKFVGKPVLLDMHVGADVVQFLGEFDHIAALADVIAEEPGQRLRHIRDDLIVVQDRPGPDIFEGIIEKMRIDLVLELGKLHPGLHEFPVTGHIVQLPRRAAHGLQIPLQFFQLPERNDAAAPPAVRRDLPQDLLHLLNVQQAAEQSCRSGCQSRRKEIDHIRFPAHWYSFRYSLGLMPTVFRKILLKYFASW